MKRIFLISSLLFVGCTIEEELPISDLSNNTNNIESAELSTNSFTKQKIYQTSLQNHEWNSGFYSAELKPAPYWVASAYTYFDYDSDGDMDVFNRADTHAYEPGKLSVWLDNNGRWEEIDVVRDQVYRGYRKMTTADLDNDGDLDMVGFTAEDAYYGNDNQSMGGIDVYLNDKGIFYLNEEVFPYSLTFRGEQYHYFFHGGALADINNDGFVDIIGGQGGKTFLNNGDGTFKDNWFSLVDLSNTGRPEGDWFSMEIIDLNKDGFNDVLVGWARNKDFWPQAQGNKDRLNMFGESKQIFFGKAEYPYVEQTPYTLYTEYNPFGKDDNWIDESLSATLDFAVVDFDNDGDLDIFTVSHSYATMAAIEYFENNNGEFVVKNSIFKNKSNIMPDGSANWIKVYDIDNDGNKEILLEATNWYGFNMWKKDSSGKYYRTLK